MTQASHFYRFRQLHEDAATWSLQTRAAGWATPEDNVDPQKIAGKPILLEQWQEALVVALELTRDLPWLPTPRLGADPDEHVWVCWEQAEKRWLHLEILPKRLNPETPIVARYRWNQQTPESFRRFETDSLNRVAEAMQAVFSRLS